MKDPFESKIKSLVEDFSYDYDPQAWDALSKKLPNAKPGLSWLGKFGIASMLALVVGIIGWNLAANQNQKESANNATQVAKNKTQTAEKSNLSAAQKTPKSNTQTKSKANQNSPTIAPNNATNQGWTQFTQEVVADPDWYLTPIALRQQAAALPVISDNWHDDSGQMPQVQEIPLAQDMPSNQIPGNHQTPCKGPKIVLDVDAINYEDGTPRIRVNLETNGSDITWSASGTLINKKSRSVDLMAFKGQTYTITAEAQLDGCKSAEKIKVTANEDYNLLAVNAFNPQSRDERNATFMPYALTIRDLRFELIVLDPDNGAVVFKSVDAQNAWDGIDQRTGQMVPAQKAYIWKVVLQEALPNEKTTYSGTIVRI
ncbi:MAG: hypothetical protein NWQ65_01180 [Crocinitomicaceae bacterium]|nr:hypothetical protein [Crocinitomicaceae bacterium]